MKTFCQFVTEADLRDKEGLGHGTGMTHRGGEKIGAERKKTGPEKRRVKAIGGGKTAPAKSYKPRKDIGVQRPQSQRVQQPEKERGSAALSAKEAQRKAYRERKAREAGGAGSRTDLKGSSTQTSKEKEKVASKLLSQKGKQKVDPKYKPRKTSGLTTKERKALYKKGERTLRDIRLKALGKKSEKELKHKVTSK